MRSFTRAVRCAPRSAPRSARVRQGPRQRQCRNELVVTAGEGPRTAGVMQGGHCEGSRARRDGRGRQDRPPGLFQRVSRRKDRVWKELWGDGCSSKGQTRRQTHIQGGRQGTCRRPPPSQGEASEGTSPAAPGSQAPRPALSGRAFLWGQARWRFFTASPSQLLPGGGRRSTGALSGSAPAADGSQTSVSCEHGLSQGCFVAGVA